jgi:hypothetical protein
MIWFVSLRYVASVPDKFPNIRTGNNEVLIYFLDGFLWFPDLSLHDPYFILPVISSFISYYNIQVKQNIHLTYRSQHIMLIPLESVHWLDTLDILNISLLSQFQLQSFSLP